MLDDAAIEVARRRGTRFSRRQGLRAVPQVGRARTGVLPDFFIAPRRGKRLPLLTRDATPIAPISGMALIAPEKAA